MIRSGTLISRAGVRLQPPWLKQDGRQAPRSIRIAPAPLNSVRLPSQAEATGEVSHGICPIQFENSIFLPIVEIAQETA